MCSSAAPQPGAGTRPSAALSVLTRPELTQEGAPRPSAQSGASRELSRRLGQEPLNAAGHQNGRNLESCGPGLTPDGLHHAYPHHTCTPALTRTRTPPGLSCVCLSPPALESGHSGAQGPASGLLEQRQLHVSAGEARVRRPGPPQRPVTLKAFRVGPAQHRCGLSRGRRGRGPDARSPDSQLTPQASPPLGRPG